jgi:molybdopterin synthase sulfur carrier subunit
VLYLSFAQGRHHPPDKGRLELGGSGMAVTVSIPPILRSHTQGQKSVEATGTTLAEVIDNLETSHVGLKTRLMTEGSLHRFVNIYVNDEDVRFLGGLHAAVRDGDEVTILPAVAGG